MKQPTPARITAMRAKLGLTRAKVANAITEDYTDVTRQAIQHWEEGARKIPRWYVYFMKLLIDKQGNNGA